MRFERLDLDSWESGLPASGFEVFHTPDALDVLDRHAAGDRLLVGGYRGEQLVGMIPLFVRRVAGLRVVSSPPPGMAIPGLGPLVMPTSPKRRKREKVNREFTAGLLDAIEADDPRTLVRFIGHPAYPDPRPYRWEGLSVDPSFTYRLPLDERSSDEVLQSFSRSLRREIGSAEESAVEVETAEHTVEAAHEVYDDVAARYAEQDEHFGPSWAYVEDLVRSLDERCRVYVAREDGVYEGGIIALYSNDAAYYWLGGARSGGNSGVNSLLHWRLIEDIVADPPLGSVHEYDLVGANTEHLCRYKAKFGADLAPYYTIESGGAAMAAAKEGYQLVNGVADRLLG
ncbi:GNAT family N-acetyltransferase [Halococcus salsus]|uniref:GNAT family N-acetyltransferase n=1 Tax=Halococcus salsus TaxID=2162894 RepID=UPI00135B0BA7|nr:GNAT family N-acetyltransferase [Halococcus salsus]